MKKIKMAQIASEFKVMCVTEIQNIYVLVHHQWTYIVSLCAHCACLSLLYTSACVCIMHGLWSATVCTAGPGDPGALVWSVKGEGEE